MKNCVHEYEQYKETQRELMRSKLDDEIFGNDCRHLHIKHDKKLVKRSCAGWICTDCNQIMDASSHWLSGEGNTTPRRCT